MKNYTRDDYKKVCAILDRASSKVSIFYRWNDYFLHIMEQNPSFQAQFESHNAEELPDEVVDAFVQEYLTSLGKLESKVRVVAPWLDTDPVTLFQYVADNQQLFTRIEQVPDDKFKAAAQAVSEKKVQPTEALNSIGITEKDVQDYEKSLPDDFKLGD